MNLINMTSMTFIKNNTYSNMQDANITTEFKDRAIGTLDALPMYKIFKELRTAIFSIIIHLPKNYTMLGNFMVYSICMAVRYLSKIMSNRDAMIKRECVISFLTEVHVLRDTSDFLLADSCGSGVPENKVFRIFDLVVQIEKQCENFKRFLDAEIKK